MLGNQPADIPACEQERLDELYLLKILDTAADERFDRYTSLVAGIFDVPIALVTLIDKDRQWFKSSCGLSLTETPRDVAFCAHAILEKDLMVVTDASKDHRFSQNPLVKNEPHIRFYAGAVLRGPTGMPLGTLCIIDKKSRNFNNIEKSQLCQFAKLVEQELLHEHKLDAIKEKANKNAYYDSATSLPNARLMTDRIEQVIQLTQHRSHRAMLILIQLENYVEIAQTSGIQQAETYLKMCSQDITDALNETCTIARWSENQLIILAPWMHQNYDETAILKLTQHILEQSRTINGATYFSTVKIGAAIYPDTSHTAKDLIAHTNMALGECDKCATSDAKIFNPRMKKNIHRRFNFEQKLRLAVDNGRLDVVYQPKVSTSTGAIQGLEALCRWHDEDLGQVPPDQFIPVAEAGGFIHQIDDFVIHHAGEQIKCWNNAGYTELHISVNITSHELLENTFIRRLQDALNAHTSLNGKLHLEVTESCFMHDMKTAIHNMNLAHDMGVKFAIDDFGAGFSSFNYLKSLPVDIVKLDRSFINEVTNNENDANIVNAMISLAHDLDMQVIAEGIETYEQFMYMKAYQCNELQGFYFGRPVQADVITERLATG